LIPEIEREENQGKNFATLRQICNAVVLAEWYKRRLQQSLLYKLYVNKNKTSGIESDDENMKYAIYEQYIKSLKEGVFNYIKGGLIMYSFNGIQQA
jgi:hypothetical protein